MTRILASLLGAGDPMFRHAVERLEAASGNMAVDVQLTADIIASSHRTLRALGLDPRDTTGPELYQGLYNMARLHDQFLARRLGGESTDPTDVLLDRIRIAAQNITMPRSTWAIKHSILKRLIATQPPRKVMKAGGYRSVDSLVKRESVTQVLGLARLLESSAWNHKFISQYEKLTPLDFEQRDVVIQTVHGERWQSAVEPHVRSQHHNLTYLKEAGAVLILPLPVTHVPGLTLAVLPRVLHLVQEIRMYSSYFKLRQVDPAFGAIIMHTLLHDPADHVRMAGQQLHWRVVRHHFGQASTLHVLPEMFEPHIMAEDLHWRKAEEILFAIEPALHFWHELDYVGMTYNGHGISFALLDVATNYVNSLPYERRVVHNMQHALWTELYSRYMGQPGIKGHVMRQLDSEALDPAIQAMSKRG